MKQWKKPHITEISAEFIVKNITKYQCESIILRYAIKQYIDNSDSTKIIAMEELSNLVGLSFKRINAIYYEIK